MKANEELQDNLKCAKNLEAQEAAENSRQGEDDAEIRKRMTGSLLITCKEIRKEQMWRPWQSYHEGM